MSTLTRQDTIEEKTPPDRHHLLSYLKIPKRQNQEVYFDTHLKWSSVSYIQGKGYDEYVRIDTRSRNGVCCFENRRAQTTTS